MGTSLFLAKLLGAVYLTIGIGILSNKEYYRSLFTEMLGSKAMFYLGGVLALVAGISIITFHNVWVKDWMVIITLVGWGAAIKGVILLVSPKTMVEQAKYWAKKLQLAGLVASGLGAVLVYYGFIA